MSKLFCPVTGLNVITRPEWESKKSGENFRYSFCMVGNNVIYSKPDGRADLKGVRESLAVNKSILDYLSEDSCDLIQIEDFADLKGTTPESRKYFKDTMNGSTRLTSMIFCNLSPPLSIAVKLGIRFTDSKLEVHIAKDYKEAIELALSLCRNNSVDQTLKYDIPYLQIINRSRSLQPLKYYYNNKLDISSSTFFNRSVLIDNCILHSQTKGCLTPEYIPLLEKMRQFYHDSLPSGSSIEYIIVDSSDLKGGCRKSRYKYAKSLQNWHKKYPIKLYIFYSTNIWMRTAVKLARPFVTFKIKVASDIIQGFELINRDRFNGTGESEAVVQKRRKDYFRSDIDKLFTFLGSIDWENGGCEADFEIEESSPFFYLFHSIKLVKEEFDALFNEQKKTEVKLRNSLEENRNLFLELQHRVKNSFHLITSMINLMAESRKSEDERKILQEINTKLDAVSNMYSLLYNSNSAGKIYLDEYLYNLIASFNITNDTILFKTRFETISISAKKVVPLGLIISELVTNSFKHAFPYGDQGTISLILENRPEDVLIKYSDNGIGFPMDRFNSFKDSLGISLIMSLADQIDAVLDFHNHNGMICKITIPKSSL